MTDVRTVFPVMVQRDKRGRNLYKCPTSVPWGCVETHETQAQKNHGQSLQRLAERGGLSPKELLAVVSGKPWREVVATTEEDAAAFVVRHVESYETRKPC